MRRFILLLLAVSVLAAGYWIWREQRSAAPARNGFDHAELDILVGRVEVMQDQVHAGLKVLGARLRDTEASVEADTYMRLRGAVARYNSLLSTACDRQVAGGNLCASAPYLPTWFGSSLPSSLPDAQLKRMAQEMQDRMVPFWDAVCAKARVRSGDQHFCAIE
jgi:hypothetical protein